MNTRLLPYNEAYLFYFSVFVPRPINVQDHISYNPMQTNKLCANLYNMARATRVNGTTCCCSTQTVINQR